MVGPNGGVSDREAKLQMVKKRMEDYHDGGTLGSISLPEHKQLRP